MSSVWYCKIGDRQYGPLSTEQVERMIQRGQLTPTSLVRRGEGGDWLKVSQVQGRLREDVGASRGGTAVGVAPPKRATPVYAAPPPRPAQLPKAKPLSAEPARPIASVAPPIAAPPAAAPPVSAPPISNDVPPFISTTVSEPSDTSTAANETAQSGRSAVVPIVIAVCATVCVVSIVGVLGVIGFLYLGQPSADVADADTSASSASSQPAALDAASELDGDDSDAERLTEDELIRAVTKWYGLRSGVRVKRGDQQVTVRLAEMWLGTDPEVAPTAFHAVAQNVLSDDVVFDPDELGINGTKSADPLGPPQRRASANTSEAVTSPAAAMPKYVFAKVEITNGGRTEALSYASWNSDESAVLVDSAGKSCRFVPVSELSSPNRLEEIEMEPGESVTDLLAFEVPQGDFRFLRLALPYSAIGMSGKPVGFEVSQESLDPYASTPAPRTPRADAAQSNDEPAASEPAPAPRPNNDPSAPPRRSEEADAATARPPSIEDLNRQIEEFNIQRETGRKPVKNDDN